MLWFCYPWLKFYFPLFSTHYHTLLPYPKTKESQDKLNHAQYTQSLHGDYVYICLKFINLFYSLHLLMTQSQCCEKNDSKNNEKN